MPTIIATCPTTGNNELIDAAEDVLGLPCMAAIVSLQESIKGAAEEFYQTKLRLEGSIVSWLTAPESTSINLTSKQSGMLLQYCMVNTKSSSTITATAIFFFPKHYY
jgi:hypothetical protein